MSGTAFPAALLLATLSGIAGAFGDLLSLLSPGWRDFAPRLLFIGGAVIVVGIAPPLRARAARLAARPMRPGSAWEVSVVATALALLPCAESGAQALWHWHRDAEAGLAALLRHQQEADELAAALAWMPGVAFAAFAVAWPVVDDMVFRGLLLRAWCREWGWLAGVAATSTIGALYEPGFASALARGVVLACLARRAGSVRAAIVAHLAASIASPLVATGAWAVPLADPDLAALDDWAAAIACLVSAGVAVPAYFALSLAHAPRLRPGDTDPLPSRS